MEKTLYIKGQKKLCLPKTAIYLNATSKIAPHQTVGVCLNYVGTIRELSLLLSRP